MQLPVVILRADPLPVPEVNTLPGPRPLSQATHDRYLQLINSCMDRNPSNRPSFVDITIKLREIASNEGVNLVVDTAPGTSAGGRTIAESSRNPRTRQMECGVCLEPMGLDTDKSMATPPCGHMYCYDCLVEIDSGKCPTCRQSYTKRQITKLFV